jgi:hypothetical protein
MGRFEGGVYDDEMERAGWWWQRWQPLPFVRRREDSAATVRTGPAGIITSGDYSAQHERVQSRPPDPSNVCPQQVNSRLLALALRPPKPSIPVGESVEIPSEMDATAHDRRLTI